MKVYIIASYSKQGGRLFFIHEVFADPKKAAQAVEDLKKEKIIVDWDLKLNVWEREVKE